ncbi:hypothetical protein VCV18_004365 [Metarhizium anisopliae]
MNKTPAGQEKLTERVKMYNSPAKHTRQDTDDQRHGRRARDAEAVDDDGGHVEEERGEGLGATTTATSQLEDALAEGDGVAGPAQAVRLDPPGVDGDDDARQERRDAPYRVVHVEREVEGPAFGGALVVVRRGGDERRGCRARGRRRGRRECAGCCPREGGGGVARVR